MIEIHDKVQKMMVQVAVQKVQKTKRMIVADVVRKTAQGDKGAVQMVRDCITFTENAHAVCGDTATHGFMLGMLVGVQKEKGTEVTDAHLIALAESNNRALQVIIGACVSWYVDEKTSEDIVSEYIIG